MPYRIVLICVCIFLTNARAIFAFDEQHRVIISVPDQKLVVLDNGTRVAEYAVSTSRYGVGDRRGSYATPLGTLEIAQKIGANAPIGSVFKGRHQTGEILPPNARGRDPIVTRILWLRGLENRNSNAFERGIYIHGTPVERQIGRPASYGCIRMKSRDVVKLFELVEIGAKINVLNLSVARGLGELPISQHHLASL